MAQRKRRVPYRDEHEQVVMLLLGLDGIEREWLAEHVQRQRSEGIKSWLVWQTDPGVQVLLDLLTPDERLNVQGFHRPERGGPTLLDLCDRSSAAILGPSLTYREARKVRRYSWREGLPIIDRTGHDEEAGVEVPRV